MITYPISFEAKTKSACGIAGSWTTDSNGHCSSISVPPEFEGPGGALSPEDLFNHALTNCFVATFKVYAEKSKLTFERVEAESRLLVDLDESKKPVMKEFFLKAKILKPSNPEKATLLANKAAKSGFILNSVKTICHFEFEITE
jgi:organic hydroperoxide reductase OsmC/OhrA